MYGVFHEEYRSTMAPPPEATRELRSTKALENCIYFSTRPLSQGRSCSDGSDQALLCRRSPRVKTRDGGEVACKAKLVYCVFQVPSYHRCALQYTSG